MTNTTQIDTLIQAYLKSEVTWTILNLRRAAISCKLRASKIATEFGRPEHSWEEIFQMQLDHDNLEAESRRLVNLNCDWSFYASALLGVKMMEEGDKEANEEYLKEPLTLMKDKLLTAVSDPKNIKRLNEWSQEDHYMIIDLGNIFRSELRKLEDPAKIAAKNEYERTREEEAVAA